MTDLESRNIAQGVIEQYGMGARIYSNSRAVQLEKKGDTESSDFWKRITKAIRTIEREKVAAERHFFE